MKKLEKHEVKSLWSAQNVIRGPLKWIVKNLQPYNKFFMDPGTDSHRNVS